MSKEQKLYCSLDIETSGFDPLTNEILEVGFVFFHIGKGKIIIDEEWTQVFKPSRPVQPGILALTGITQAELDGAPKFAEHNKFLQEKLGQAVIVGHNITFDTKFLESSGIKFFGGLIDTLDLVQFLLPTHHSYNLENLMHVFGISHKDAHRALADSKATLKLLEKLLQVFCSFPENLKQEIKDLIKGFNFPWEEFLPISFPPLALPEVKTSPAKPAPSAPAFKFKPNTFFNFPLNQDFQEEIATGAGKNKILLVLPKAREALNLYRRGAVSGAVFLPEHQFSEKKFAAFKKRKNLSPDEVKFLLKILVWQTTNWQKQTILDLNLSFFGGQFKNFIIGGKVLENKTAEAVVCDLQTFFYLAENELYQKRKVMVCGLNEFEAGVTANIGTKTSWGYISYLLKSFYNPELGSGETEHREVVEQALNAGDLFFGLASALLQTNPPGFVYYKIIPQTLYEEKYQKIKSAAESYTEKLLILNKDLGSKEIERFAENLLRFFAAEDNRVKWVELSENRCAFLSMPIDISGLVKNILQPFSAVSFADTFDSSVLPKFFLNRLGLKDFSVETVALKSPTTRKTKQGDLFSAIKKVMGKKDRQINYHCISKAADFNELVKLVSSKGALPAAVLFGNPSLVRQFYEQNYQTLKPLASALVQSNSGGSNKIFRNFGINKNSLLLATDKFILKSVSLQGAVESVSNISVNTLILCHLPFEQFTHPYQEALSASLDNAFEDYALPRALYNFHRVLKFFYTPALKDVFIIDSKLSKPYAKVFKDYYQVLPGARLTE